VSPCSPRVDLCELRLALTFSISPPRRLRVCRTRCKERPEETFLSCFKELRDNQDDGPHFMPERIKSVGPGTPSARVPKRCTVEHEWVSTSAVRIPIEYDETGKTAIKWLGSKTCKNCYAKSRHEGEMVFVEGQGQARRFTSDGVRCGQTRWACNRCKVNLCSQECFDEWDHARNQASCVSCDVE
jgi:hypothetical protein